jgi:phosphotriesterase-related protein
MDMTADDTAYHRSLMEKYGIVLGYDNFGNEMYYDSVYPGCGGVPDKMRVKGLVDLLRSGYEKHLVLSHDVCFKIALTKYGGYGYSHVLRHIIPQIRAEGVTPKQVEAMLIDNPRRILAWV